MSVGGRPRMTEQKLVGYCGTHGRYTPLPHTGGDKGPSCPLCWCAWKRLLERPR